MDQKTVERVLAHQPSREEHVRLLRDMVDIRSPCGGERDIGEFIHRWFVAQGIDSFLQFPAPDRPNAIGHLGGKGGGKSLIFNGHTDTAMGDPEDVAKIAGGKLPKELSPKSWEADGYIGGDGAVNDKGPVSAFMMAAKTLADSGVELKGDVFFTAVCGEIERAAVDEFQGPKYIGGGFGTRHLVGSGIRADYALVCEPSNFTMTSTLAGVLYLKVSTHGEAMYVAEIRHKSDGSGKSVGRSQNAIENMVGVIQALNAFAERYEVEGQYRAKDGGLITPTVNVGCIRGGLPYKPNYSPATCSVYVDVRIPPFEEPINVKRKVQEHLTESGFGDVDVEMFRSHKGYEAKGVEPLAAVAAETFKEVTGNPPAESTSVLNTRWNDVNPFNEVGIPAMKFGPGRGIVRKEKVDDLLIASKVYSLIALKMCG